KGNLDERTPLGSCRFAAQAHVHFPWKAIALARMAGDTRADHVFPRRCSAPIARHNVIQIEFAPIENLSAVLAGVLVALKDVMTCELYVLFRKPIENQQDNHSWDTNLKRNRRYHLVVGRIRR